MARRTLPLLLLLYFLLPAVALGWQSQRATDAKPTGRTGRSDRDANVDPAASQLEQRVKQLEADRQRLDVEFNQLGEKIGSLALTAPATTNRYERWGLLVGLAVSLAGLGWMFFVTHSLNKQSQEMAKPRKADSQAVVGGEEVVCPNPDLKEYIDEALAKQKEELSGEIRDLQETINDLSAKVEKMLSAPPEISATLIAEGNGRDGDRAYSGYPASVDDCLTRLKQAQVSLVPVNPNITLFGNLSQDENNKFWLAQETGGELLLLPKARRFGSEDEFHTFYENFYDCAEPSAGDVSIIRPSTVEEDDTNGGWKLKRKGLLKVE